MKIEELLKHLEYSKCGCEVDYRPELGLFNGICPDHEGSLLMVDGKPVSVFMKEVKDKARKLAQSRKGIV